LFSLALLLVAMAAPAVVPDRLCLFVWLSECRDKVETFTWDKARAVASLRRKEQKPAKFSFVDGASVCFFSIQDTHPISKN